MNKKENKKITIHIPADIPHNKINAYTENYSAITHNTNRLFLFSCDQKIEHLNKNFYGPGIDPQDNDPEHLFYIASHARIGAMATHLGLLAHYAEQYPTLNYLVKLNAKTDLIAQENKDPLSEQLWTVDDVLNFKKKTGLNLRGIGYTVYLGSEYESIMLTQAAQAVFNAHQNGLVAVLWMYPRGKNVGNERDGALIAGAAGVAATLGADFAKINPPDSSENKSIYDWLSVAAQAAGKTQLLCSGGKQKDPEQFLQELYNQLHSGGTAGCAVGRNIHQRSARNAIALSNAIAAIVYDNVHVKKALEIYETR